ncbi:MAG: hypothetical protein ACR2P8_09340 [Myxococcota bacterium]
MSFFLVSLFLALLVGALRFQSLVSERPRTAPRVVPANAAPARPAPRRVVVDEAA